MGRCPSVGDMVFSVNAGSGGGHGAGKHQGMSMRGTSSPKKHNTQPEEIGQSDAVKYDVMVGYAEMRLLWFTICTNVVVWYWNQRARW